MRAALVVLVLLLAALPPSRAASVPAVPGPGWEAKADAPLRAAVTAPSGWVSVGVQGAALPAPALPPATRGEWQAHWRAEAAPFLGWLRIAARALGGEVTGEAPAIDAAHVRIPAAQVPLLLASPAVRRAGLDQLGATQVAGGGPGGEVGLNESVAKLQAPDLWALGYRGEDVKLAILDTGILASHDTMRDASGASRVVGWYDATGPSGVCAEPCDVFGHGTYEASIAAGSDLFNASAPVGVAPRAMLIGVRIFQSDSGTWEDAQEGLQAAFDLGAEVANNAWGASCDNEGLMAADLVEALADGGMLSVFGAGNRGGFGVECPGIADKVTTVGAVSIDEVPWGSSSRGPCVWRNATRPCPDVVAVGIGVVAASSACDACYGSMNGTSPATSHVAGVVALLQQAKKAELGEGLRAIDKQADVLLRNTARDLGAEGPDNDSGWGLVQGKAAYDTMVGAPGINVTARLTIPWAEVRTHTTSDLGLTLTNLGLAGAEGHVTFRAVQLDTGTCPPSCETVAIADQGIGVFSFGERTYGFAFRGADHAAGTWRLEASYAFDYTDPADGMEKQGLAEASGTFVVRKVVWDVQQALPPSATTGSWLAGGLTVRNVGNDDAVHVQVAERFDPQGHAPAPVVPPGDGLLGLLADPAPDDMKVDLSPAALVYTWQDVGPLTPGATWRARCDFVAASPGAWVFRATLSYEDGAGDADVANFAQQAAVTLT